MGLLFAAGSPTSRLTDEELREGLALAMGRVGQPRRVLAIPPDATRFHSRAGRLTEHLHDLLGTALCDVLPALGTHRPMTPQEITRMFGRVPHTLFREHHWRRDVVTLGEVPEEYVEEVSEGRVHYPWPAQVNRLLVEGGHDLLVSLGQVVPHEVVGMANGVKNLLIGTGGAPGIDRSHFLGAVYGMERMMGRIDTPVRRVLQYADRRFLAGLPVLYVQTVVAKEEDGAFAVRGLYVSDDEQAFEQAAVLSQQCNFTRLPKEIHKAVVFLDPHEFRSTWLGNKSLYRTRMALADGAELIVLAPGVEEFGEDPTIDRLIRRHGYRGTPATLEAVQRDAELAGNLSAAAHLIHGSSEGRFTVRYCPGKLSRAEIEAVGYEYGDLAAYARLYPPDQLRDGWHVVDGEEIFFVSNPGLGLWAYEGRRLD